MLERMFTSINNIHAVIVKNAPYRKSDIFVSLLDLKVVAIATLFTVYGFLHSLSLYYTLSSLAVVVVWTDLALSTTCIRKICGEAPKNYLYDAEENMELEKKIVSRILIENTENQKDASPTWSTGKIDDSPKRVFLYLPSDDDNNKSIVEEQNQDSFFFRPYCPIDPKFRDCCSYNST